MFAYEKDLQNAIMDAGVIEYDEGVIEDFKKEFQIGNKYVDILGVDHDNGRVFVIELKQDQINAAAVCQILDYICDVREAMQHSEDYMDYDVWGLLVGQKCTVPGAIKFLQPLVQYVEYKGQVALDLKTWTSTECHAEALKADSSKLVEHFGATHFGDMERERRAKRNGKTTKEGA